MHQKQLLEPICGLLILLTATSSFASELRIDNLRLYQSDSSNFSKPSRMYIDNGVIQKITLMKDGAESTGKVVDAGGKYAIPSLTDLHVHLGPSGSKSGKYFQYLPVNAHFNTNLYLGVTNVVDLFSTDDILRQAKVLSAANNMPNFFHAGALFTNLGGHGTQFGGGALEVTSDESIEALWKVHLAKSPALTKAVIEDFGGRGSTLTDSQLAELGRRSASAGLPFFVHVSTLDDAKRAINAGATALAHGINGELLDDEFVEMMLKHEVAYIPTLSVFYNQNIEFESQGISKQIGLLESVHPKLKQCLFEKVSASPLWAKAIWAKRKLAYKNIVKLHNAGVLIGAGSDAGNPYTLHGVGLHNELQALHKAGLTVAQSINSATINAARVLGKEDQIGALRVKAEASFILYEYNPLQDISNLAAIHSIYKSGMLVDRARLKSENLSIRPIGSECNESQSKSEVAAGSIDDFTYAELASFSAWQAMSDQMMSGTSKAKVSKSEDSMMISVSLGQAGSFGAWAGASRQFKSTQDASAFKGLSVTYKGSNMPFSISVHHADVNDWDHFSHILEPSDEWKTLNIPFTEFKQFGYGSPVEFSADMINGVSFLVLLMVNTLYSLGLIGVGVSSLSWSTLAAWFIWLCCFFWLPVWAAASLIFYIRKRSIQNTFLELLVACFFLIAGMGITDLVLQWSFTGYQGMRGFIVFGGILWATPIYFVTRFIESNKKAVLEKQARKDAQLQTLRYQLNPHFMFNSLNTISAYIYSKPAFADEVLHELADILRYSLDTANQSYVSLQQEIDIINKYVYIEKARFGEKLSLNFDLPDDIQAIKIPPLLLQPMVENAVKHNVDKAPLEISIKITSEGKYLLIEVKDNGIGFPKEVLKLGYSLGVGMQNIKKRVEELHGGSIALSNQNGAQVQLSIVMS